MNKEKYRKSLDKITAPQSLINKTLMNIEAKKKRNYFMPFYVASLVATCAIILVATYIIDNNTTTNSSINNKFLIDVEGDYTFEHIFDFNILKEEEFDNIYVLKYENKIEDNDYVIPYKYYVDFMELLKPLKESKIETIQEFNEQDYDEVVINNEKYFYVSKEKYDMVYYDEINKVYYQINTIYNEETIGKIKDYINDFTRMRSVENFIEQTNIKGVKQSNYSKMYLVSKTNNMGEWEEYMVTRDYKDYEELMTYIEKLRYNKVNKTINEFDVSKYYGNMLIQFDGTYMYIPETINGKILIYVSDWINPIYYEIELQQKDYNTLESIKNIIKTRGKYESAYNRIVPETQIPVDPYTDMSRSITVLSGTSYARAWIKGGNNLYITLTTNEIKNNKYESLDTSKIENNPTFLIEEHIRDYKTKLTKGENYISVVYVTNDKKLKMIKISDIVKTGNTSSAIYIQVDGPVKNLEEMPDEKGFAVLYAVLENGTKVKIDI